MRRIAVPIAELNDKKGWGKFLQPSDPRVEAVVAKHLFVLARKRAQFLTKDEYGKYRKNGWQKELSQFITGVLIPEMPWWHSLSKKPPSDRHLIKVAKIVERLVAEECSRFQKEWRDDEVPEDGIGYERYCQRLLASNGWEVTETKKSGDQGVDLLGRYGTCAVAFQCKRFSRPVGNKAVQEVVAGRKFYLAHLAAIVTNTSYTEAAKSLAIANKVLLLHHSELSQLSKKIRIEKSNR
jgi:restriction system protein